MGPLLFTDIGGVLLTNGWDGAARQRAAAHFGFDLDAFNARHKEIFGTYELGKISLKEYLQHALFFQKRSFSLEAFEAFMHAQSKPLPGMIEWMTQLKQQHRLKIVAISNEGRELTEHRVKAFALNKLIDFFVVSSYVGLRKPDPAIYHLALDLAHTPASKALYLEDRELFVEVAKELGMRSICHKNLEATKIACSP